MGAGIAGLSVAYSLVKQGTKVVVLKSQCRGTWKQHQILPHLSPIFVRTWNLLLFEGGEERKIERKKTKMTLMLPTEWITMLLHLRVHQTLNVKKNRVGVAVLFPGTAEFHPHVSGAITKKPIMIY